MALLRSRRDFLKQTALAASAVAGGGYLSSRSRGESKSPNEKLNVGMIT